MKRKISLRGASEISSAKRKSIAKIKFMEEISGMEKTEYKSSSSEAILYRGVKYVIGECADGGCAVWSHEDSNPKFFFFAETMDEAGGKAIMAINDWHKYKESL